MNIRVYCFQSLILSYCVIDCDHYIILYREFIGPNNKAVVKEVSTVKSEPSISPRGYVVTPDKNQFFKFAGPNQVWVIKNVIKLSFAGCQWNSMSCLGA